MHAQRIAMAAAGIVLLLPAGAQQQIQKKEIPSVNVGDGAAMYRGYCASCHGPGGKGDGPAASALKTVATDLTKLARDHDGVFPGRAVLFTLRSGGGAHGTSDMPVWGELFRSSFQSEPEIYMRTYNLMRYLESIQNPPAEAPKASAVSTERQVSIRSVHPSLGGNMYRAYCGACHGPDGRGDGPSAFALKNRPPDLTTLRSAGGGNFPADRLRTLLMQPGAGVHGSTEMPVWGDLFRSTGEDDSLIRLRVFNLVRYLEWIQR